MGKFYNIDPHTCSIEELKEAIEKCEDIEGYYHNMEQACKIFINSAYGAMASPYYVCNSIDMAESVTLQGQDLIKFSVIVLNYYFNELWHNDTEAHDNIRKYMKAKYPDFDEEKFMKLSMQKVSFGDTLQVYGDSCDKDTLISTTTGEFRVVDLFMENYLERTILRNKEFVTCNKKVINYSNGVAIEANIKHIIRHRVSKEKWKVCSMNGYEVIVTADHSVIVVRNNSLIEVKPSEIKYTDDLVTLTKDNSIEYSKVLQIECIGNYNNEYVYDIEVETTHENEHNFFGNKILIHNTDSVSKDSIIRTAAHPEGITIEDFYNENINNVGDTTKAGHTSVNTSDKVFNWNEEAKNYLAEVNRIIRHKVSKPKWKLKTKSGKEVIVTEDHSLIVFRDGKQLTVKPSDIIKTDKALILVDDLKYSFEDIKSCKCIGQFEEEFVYDIEVKDKTHTFICNDILVHNSAYITFQPVIDSCNISQDMATDFILAINKYVLEVYLEKMFDEYAHKFNCKKNLQAFELEKIARTVIMLAKKKYILDVSWKEPDVHIEPLHAMAYTGIEVVQGSTPEFCRKMMKEFIEFICKKLAFNEKIEYSQIISKLKDIKNKFSMQSPNEISKSFKMSEYEKFIIDDKNTLTFSNATCPIHVRGAAHYNHALYNKAKKYKSKYNIIRKGDKVKFYYTADDNVFSFLPNEFPVEFAPKMNIDIQFEKMLLEPLNRIIEAAGFQRVSSTLTYSAGLW